MTTTKAVVVGSRFRHPAATTSSSFGSNGGSNNGSDNGSGNDVVNYSSFGVRASFDPDDTTVECVDYDVNNDNDDGCRSPSSSSSSYSSSSSSSTRDHRNRVTFRDETKRAPKSVNAVSSSKSSSTPSREEDAVVVVGGGGGSFGGCFGGGGLPAINHGRHRGDNYNRNGVTSSSSYGYGASNNETSRTFMSTIGLVSNPVDFTVCNPNKRDTNNNNDNNAAYNNNNNNVAYNNNLATSSMFTKEDVDAITPLQISTYLTSKQRETIGATVLRAELKTKSVDTYSSIDGGGRRRAVVCNVCDMPRLGRWSSSKSSSSCKSSSSSSSSSSSGSSSGSGGSELEAIECPICPVLKKRVLEKILDGCF